MFSGKNRKKIRIFSADKKIPRVLRVKYRKTRKYLDILSANHTYPKIEIGSSTSSSVTKILYSVYPDQMLDSVQSLHGLQRPVCPRT